MTPPLCVPKRCEVASYWAPVANEDQSFDLGSKREGWVRYGMGERWAYQYVKGRGDCSNATFPDYVPLTRKICQVQTRSDGGGVVAAEGGTFDVPSDTVVRYGSIDRWTYRRYDEYALDERCDNENFGVDPYPKEPKHCEVVKSMGAGVVVGINDRGILPHPDMDANVVPGYNFVIPGDPPADPGNVYRECVGVQEDRWHGLGMAGIVAAVGDNRRDLAGVAPMAQISMLKTQDCRGTIDLAHVANSLVWATSDDPALSHNPHKAKVINMSWTVPEERATPSCRSTSTTRGLTGRCW